MNFDYDRAKKTLLSASLLLSMMLTGCYDRRIKVDGEYVTYYDNGVRATVSYETVDNHFRVVTFSQDEITFTRPVIVNERTHNDIPYIEYIDMEKGMPIIKRYAEGDTIIVGEGIVIEEEKAFTPYLFLEGNVEESYEVKGLVQFYFNKIEPSLNQETEMALN